MIITSGTAEVLHVANKPGITETGGGHGEKGVDFQRWWAVLRMVEMEQSKESDFLLLFQAIQDITELDSGVSPTRVRIYQVKKKDRGEWTWPTLTGTAAPSKRKSKTPDASAFKKVGNSPIGKLHFSIAAFNQLPVEAYFISNAGCDVPLTTGGNAATSMPCSLADAAPEHVQLLTQALQSLSVTGSPTPDLNKLKLQKVAIHPDEPSSHVITSALALLMNRSPRHAGQAASFVEALYLKISPLSRHTNTCSSFDELVKQRGFSRQDFISALCALEEIPDYSAYLKDWLNQLQNEGMDFMLVTGIRAEAARVIREQLVGANPAISQSIRDFCDAWLEAKKPDSKLRPYFDDALAELKKRFSHVRDPELLARFAMRAIKKCVDQN